MICPTCGKEVSGDAGYCRFCGGELQAAVPDPVQSGGFCTFCGAPTAPGTAFCVACGKPLAGAGSPKMVKNYRSRGGMTDSDPGFREEDKMAILYGADPGTEGPYTDVYGGAGRAGGSYSPPGRSTPPSRRSSEKGDRGLTVGILVLAVILVVLIGVLIGLLFSFGRKTGTSDSGNRGTAESVVPETAAAEVPSEAEEPDMVDIAVEAEEAVVESPECPGLEEEEEMRGGPASAGEAFYGIWCAADTKESGVQSCCKALSNAGYRPEVLVTSEWSNLNPKTYYAVTAGRYASKAEAQAALSGVKAVYGDAYVKYSGDYIG